MAKRGFYNGKRYKPTAPGGGLQPGTVDWELARRQVRKQRVQEDEALEARIAERDSRMGKARGIRKQLRVIAVFQKFEKLTDRIRALIF